MERSSRQTAVNQAVNPVKPRSFWKSIGQTAVSQAVKLRSVKRPSRGHSRSQAVKPPSVKQSSGQNAVSQAVKRSNRGLSSSQRVQNRAQSKGGRSNSRGCGRRARCRPFRWWARTCCSSPTGPGRRRRCASTTSPTYPRSTSPTCAGRP